MHVICFSHRRQLQLHGYLASSFHHVRPHQVTVIYPEQDYSIVERCFRGVKFVVEEPDFNTTLRQVVADVKDNTIAFGCDDMIFTRSLWGQIQSVLKDPMVLGYSIRLHGKIDGAPQCRPWNWPKEEFTSHWGYPFDLTGTIYRTETIRNMLPNIGEMESPNRFEREGALFMKRCLAGHYPWMSRDEFPGCLIQQVNTVQSTFSVPDVTKAGCSPEELDELYKAGKRLDWRHAAGVVHSDVWTDDKFWRLK